MSRPALEIRGLYKAFPGFTLGPLDLTVPAGAIYGFVGPNGAGKTTTLELVFGMGATGGGTITALGLDHLRDDVSMKRRVGFVSPEIDLRPWRTVERALRFVRGFYPTWDDDYCRRLLDGFDIDLRAKILPLSFGTRIKLALVLALAHRPELLILDEPTVGLDAISRQQVFAELLAAVRDGEHAVLISSHSITDLERFADHVGMIKDGQMLFEGPITDVLERYRLVDLEADDRAALAGTPGVYVQTQDRGRWRVVLDLTRSPLDALRARGARPIAETPMSLEEVFIALGRRQVDVRPAGPVR